MLDASSAFAIGQCNWLAEQFDSIQHSVKRLLPSECAEQKRYLTQADSPMAGPYRFAVAPYLREIIDNLSVDSPVREVTVMKGVQLCYTSGVLENEILYAISHLRTSPVMMVTADQDLAKIRMETYIQPMLEHSSLSHLIKSSDAGNPRKTGKTAQKLEWEGGGFLIPYGAKNADKLRSIPIEILLLDELDTFAERVGKDGDPERLVRDRTAAYEETRKILSGSTPLLKGQSRIHARYLRGDQRKYFVCCLKCSYPQELRWEGQTDDGVSFGIQWDPGDPKSARYVCRNCQHPHVNDDKVRLLAPEHGAQWRPTAEPKEANHRSYQISALYSPVGMQTWAACVEKWLAAWDVQNNRALDYGKLQVFYNNVLGVPYELKGEKVKLEAVSNHRRADYSFGEVPNAFAIEHCLSRVLLVTCAVDVHGDNLAVAVFGWCRDRRAFLLDYWRFEGDTSEIETPETWGRLEQLIDEHRYVADDGTTYGISMTLIDSGYRADVVYEFAQKYEDGVFPIKGREIPPKAATFREFAEFTTTMGNNAYAITVDLYKDRWSTALRREWSGLGLQPGGHFNAPVNVTSAQLKELTVETKVPKAGTDGGYGWVRPSGAANELWDLLVYNSAALDIIAWRVCRVEFELDTVIWPMFWKLCEDEQRFFEAA